MMYSTSYATCGSGTIYKRMIVKNRKALLEQVVCVVYRRSLVLLVDTLVE